MVLRPAVSQILAPSLSHQRQLEPLGNGDYEGTKLYYERALGIREKVLGADHPDTVVVRENLNHLLREVK